MKSRSDQTRCAITTLTGFRTGLHQCWTSWPDAAFELTDTVLCMRHPHRSRRRPPIKRRTLIHPKAVTRASA